jgi:hypothetical protein
MTAELFPPSTGNQSSTASRLPIEPLGLRHTQVGGHTARSMMLTELQAVLSQTPTKAQLADIERAVVDENILNKPTLASRRKSLRHLQELYGLDGTQALFRVLRDFSARDPASIPLLALVCAYSRDPQLRQSFELIAHLRVGEVLPRETMEAHLESGFPGRFSPAMKKSMAQNVNTTWTNAGHLSGKVKKTRRLPESRPEAAAYAMFVGYLSGLRGQQLLQSPFGLLVAKDPSVLLAQLPLASARGLIGFKFAGGIFEFDFRRLLTPEEQRICDVAA